MGRRVRYGHNEAQLMFEEIGRRLGFEVRRTFSDMLPTDGVWFLKAKDGAVINTQLPVVAIEVVVSEGPKAMQGDITILERVSPSLGIIVLHEDEIRRRLLAKRTPNDVIDYEIARLRQMLAELVQCSRQRIEVWSAENLRRVYQLSTGRQSLYTK
jgi:hypothetical protein